MFVRPRPKKSILPPPAKRRKKHSAIEEINFDFNAREDYLTGFHKRKVQRAKQAQEEAAKKAKEERIAMRKQIREDRRRELEAHVDAVNTMLKQAKASGADSSDEMDDEGWDGIQDDESVGAIDHEAEYIDEDRYTTVTVEAVGVSKEGLHKITADGEEDIEKAGSFKTISTSGRVGEPEKNGLRRRRRRNFGMSPRSRGKSQGQNKRQEIELKRMQEEGKNSVHHYECIIDLLDGTVKPHSESINNLKQLRGYLNTIVFLGERQTRTPQVQHINPGNSSNAYFRQTIG